MLITIFLFSITTEILKIYLPLRLLDITLREIRPLSRPLFGILYFW